MNKRRERRAHLAADNDALRSPAERVPPRAAATLFFTAAARL